MRAPDYIIDCVFNLFDYLKAGILIKFSKTNNCLPLTRAHKIHFNYNIHGIEVVILSKNHDEDVTNSTNNVVN